MLFEVRVVAEAHPWPSQAVQNTLVFMVRDLTNLNHWPNLLLQNMMQDSRPTILTNRRITVEHSLDIGPIGYGVVVAKVDILSLIHAATNIALDAANRNRAFIADRRESTRFPLPASIAEAAMAARSHLLHPLMSIGKGAVELNDFDASIAILGEDFIRR